MTYKKSFLAIFLISALAVFGFMGFAVAASTLSVSATGSGDNIQINVYGDANSSVLLFYGNTFVVLGTTSSSGSYSATISAATYNIAANSQVYVRVGGISGQQSNTVVWPWTQSSGTSSSTLTLSQSAILVNVGQTSTITANSSYLFLQSNTNPSVANVNLNGSNVAITANAYGSTVARICTLGSTTNCADLTVTVQNYGTSQLGFSRNNFSIYSGQSDSVSVTGGTGTYIISNNSNPTSVQASISGSTITLSATSTAGSASITVCSSNMNYCGILNVNATTINSTAVSFSQSNPFVPLSQSITVTIYGGTGTNFYVSSNSNPSVVQPNISSNILTLVPITTGSSQISICATAGSCATLTATVNNAGSANEPISLSQNSLSILAGQQTSVTIYGGSAPYYFYSDSSNSFNGGISGNILTVYGVNQGFGTARVCASVGCANLSISVGTTTSTSSAPSFSQNNISLNPGQQTMVYISNTGAYYMANNSAPLVASVAITGTSVMVTAGTAVGNTQIAICQNGGSCSTLNVTVATTQQTTTQTTTTQTYFALTRYLGPGDSGDDVLQLQKALVKLGLLTATPNGYYGTATTAAVKAFQAQKSIKQTGNVGVATKAALESANIIMSSTSTSVADIQAAIDALLAQIRAIRGY
jgi:hypothetical protein